MPHKCYDDTYKNWNDNGCMNLNIERTSFNVPDCESTSGMNVSDSGMKVPPPAVCMSKTLVKNFISTITTFSYSLAAGLPIRAGQYTTEKSKRRYFCHTGIEIK